MGFPYDGEEAVLEPELFATAARYRQIFVVPARIGKRVTGTLPDNTEVIDIGWDHEWTRGQKLKALKSEAAVKVLRETLTRPSNWCAYLRGARTYLDILARDILKADLLSAWIDGRRLADAVFYDYWFENATLPLSLLRERRQVKVAIARAHRFDIFDSAWSEVGKVPFRDFKAAHLDAIFAVSEQGASYIRSHLRSALRRKVRVSRLGVPLGEPLPDHGGDSPLIVSCSSLTERKRVDLIVQALKTLSHPVRWVHFGDGPERPQIESLAAELPSDVQWELHGKVDNAEVLKFYRCNKVAAFVSTSESEGIPVSMMEAQSFGIPIVASAVGGIPELVSASTGVLIDPDAKATEIGRALELACQPGRFDRDEIRTSFSCRYEASAAFGAFADSLLGLLGRQSESPLPTVGDQVVPLPVTVTTVLFNSEVSLEQYASGLRPLLDANSIRLIAVDNASPDLSADLIRRLLPQVEVIENGVNLGFAAGCNRAWPKVQTTYWMLLNPDVILTGPELSQLVNWMDGRPHVGVASPRLRRADGTELTVARPHDSLWRPPLERLRLHKLIPEPWRSEWLLPGGREIQREIRGWVPGAAIIARGEAVKSAGLLDESLFMYGEDREWCWRMSRAGWAIGVCDQVMLTHDGGTSAATTWTDRERVTREVIGHLRATTQMRGSVFMRAFAILNGALLCIDSFDLRREAASRSELRARGRVYLRVAARREAQA